MFCIVSESLDDRSRHCLLLSNVPPFARSCMLRTFCVQRFQKSIPSNEELNEELFDDLPIIDMFPVFNLYTMYRHSSEVPNGYMQYTASIAPIFLQTQIYVRDLCRRTVTYKKQSNRSPIKASITHSALLHSHKNVLINCKPEPYSM
jgi:hypothetical protein